jgi:hypothetical protein
MLLQVLSDLERSVCRMVNGQASPELPSTDQEEFALSMHSLILFLKI